MFDHLDDDTSYLLLLRHGATASNVAKPPRLQGRGVNHGLSDEGREQARRTAEFLASVPLAAVYSSTLLRARETAEQIARPHGLEARALENLEEVDVGQWEGWTWPEIRERDPEGYRLHEEDCGRHPYRGGETLQQVLARVQPVLEGVMREHLGRCAAVVGHNQVNRAYLAHLLKLPLAHIRRIPQNNCGINLIRLRRGELQVRTLNSAFHLA